MELRDFITHIHRNDQWQLPSIVCFTGQSYPVLFLSQLRSYLRIKKNYSIVTLSPTDENLHINLHMSLMTDAHLYWLSSMEELSKKEQKEFCTFLGTYNGPHRIVLFIPEELSNYCNARWTTIKIPEFCDKPLFLALADWYTAEGKNKLEMAFCTALFKQRNKFSLDDACLFMYYQSVIGKNVSLFVSQWLPQLINPSTSLFTLSQSLFSQDAIAFWKQWQLVALQFSPQFWIAFWSEQLWRASSFIVLQKNNQNREAKAMSARLPFSFVQRDWRHYAAHELKNAHDYIYALDYNLKHGATDYGFDLFYAKFFLGSFSKNV